MGGTACVQVSFTPMDDRPQTHRERLDELYPPGADRTGSRDARASYLGAVAIPAEPSPFLRAAIESISRESDEAIAGIDLYERDEHSGRGRDRASHTVCDYVFFDTGDRILRAYRRFRPCSPSRSWGAVPGA